MAMVKVYRFRTYDGTKDDYFVSSRMATLEKIWRLKIVEAVPGTETEIDERLLIPNEGWTERNFKL
jgi:hypothetical protein